MTTVNGILFGDDVYTFNKLKEILKQKGHYYKCRVCGKKFVKKEGDLCEGCQYKAKDFEDSENEQSS